MEVGVSIPWEVFTVIAQLLLVGLGTDAKSVTKHLIFRYVHVHLKLYCSCFVLIIHVHVH